ncbi:MAG: carbohydrate ABC transporter permease [Flexilinea sp.]
MRRQRIKNKRIIGWLLLAPITIWLLCFALAPMLYGLRLSFFNARINNINNPEFISLGNYIKLFQSSDFRTSLWWSFRFALISTTIQMFLGILIAQLYNRYFPGKRIAITLFLLPMVISPFLMGTMFRLLFNEFVGPVAYLISGITGTTAMLGVTFVNSTILGADTVNRTPFVFINVYSAMQGVSQELIEAAKVDGANAFQRLRHVTFPLISSILWVTFLEKLLASFLIFDLVFALSAGGPGSYTQSVSIFIYRRAFQRSDYGMANAASFTLAIMLLIPSLYLVRRMLRGVK